LTPQPLRTWLGGAGISIATLILFGLSTWLVQRSAKRARVREAALA
jgi:hypothetical protein